MTDRLTLTRAFEGAGIKSGDAEIYDAIHDNVATKRDLERIEAALKVDLSRVEARLKADLSRIEAALKADTSLVRVDLGRDIDRIVVRIVAATSSRLRCCSARCISDRRIERRRYPHPHR
jgi:hypothetical protein